MGTGRLQTKAIARGDAKVAMPGPHVRRSMDVRQWYDVFSGEMNVLRLGVPQSVRRLSIILDSS